MVELVVDFEFMLCIHVLAEKMVIHILAAHIGALAHERFVRGFPFYKRIQRQRVNFTWDFVSLVTILLTRRPLLKCVMVMFCLGQLGSAGGALMLI